MHAFLHHEEHGQHDQRHVVVPGSPAARLVVRHARLFFGIAEVALDDVATQSVADEDARIFVGRGVAQGKMAAWFSGSRTVVGFFIGVFPS